MRRSAVGVSGGEALPSWAAGLGAQSWSQPASGNTMRAVASCPADNCAWSCGGSGCFEAMGNAWNGGIWAPDLGTWGSIMVVGGGHNTYKGNDVLRLRLDTLQFERLSDPYPTPADASDSDGAYGDGSPVMAHTYATVPWRTGHNQMYMFLGASTLANDNNGNFAPLTSIFTPSIGVVQDSGDAWTRVTSDDGAADIATFACYDASRDVFYGYYATGAVWRKYDPNASAGSRVTAFCSAALSINGVCVVCPLTDELVHVDLRGDAGAGVGLYTVSLSGTPAMTKETLSGDGAAMLATEEGGAIVWSATLGKLVFYGCQGDLFLIHPTTWVVEHLPNTGTAPAEDQVTGTNAGPFNKAALLESDATVIFVTCNAVDEKPYVYEIQ